MIHELVHSETDSPPSKIIIATDNMGALQHIFQGSPGKAQSCSTTFWSHILDILDKHENIQFALTWCPGHFNIKGNEWADSLAKSSSRMRMYHRNTDYKSLSYISSLHKCKIGKEWTHRWTNQPSTLCSKFHVANHIPPSTKPTKRFITLDRHTFSLTLQCWTGHTHIGKYYCWFIPSENQSCHCSDTLQMRTHTLYECKTHFWYCHILGTGRTRNIEVLLGSERGIKRVAQFLRTSQAYDKRESKSLNNVRHNGRRRGRMRDLGIGEGSP